MEDFEFHIGETSVSADDLKKMDDDFLRSLENSTSDAVSTSSNDAFTFWFLIILLLLFIFFIILGVVMVVRGRRRRYEYVQVGYR